MPATTRAALIGGGFAICRILGGPYFRHAVRVEELAEAKILILKPCCLGDVVFATPLIRELRRTLPSASITFGVGSHSRPAVEGNPHLDDLLNTGSVGSGPFRLTDLWALAADLRTRRFDACFVLERSAILAILPLLAGIPRRIGIDSGGRGFVHNVGVSAQPFRPESELYLDLLRAIGGRPISGELEYLPPAEAGRRIDRLVAERIPSGRPIVVLHCAGGMNPGMSLARKRWPIERFAALGRRITASGGVVVLVGAPEDRDVVEDLRRSIAGSGEPTSSSNGHADVVDLVGQLSLGELATLAARASAYVGNDSGPTHLAEAAGARAIMLFGPSDPIVYGPRSRRAVPVSAGLWCSPCFVDGRVAPCANVLCMSSISVERVWAEIAPLLSASAGR